MKKSMSYRWVRAAALLLSAAGFLPNQLHAQNCVPLPSGLVSWWRAEGDATDAFGTNNGALQNGGTFGPGEVGQAFQFNGSSQDVRVAASAGLDVGQGPGFTVEGWVKPSDSAARPLFEWVRDAGGSGVHLWVNYPSAGYLFADVIDSSGTFHVVQSSPGAVQANNYQHIAITYDKVSGVATLYANGAVVQQSNIGSFTPQTSYPFYIGARANAAYFAGLIDELAVYSRALSGAEVLTIYQAGSSGKCTSGVPVITSQPHDKTVYVGDNATFSVGASGTEPFTYQWEFNGTAIPTATNSSLTVTNVQITDQGNYSVFVTNSVGWAPSSNAVLTVLAPPTCAPIPAGIVSWWKAEGDTLDAIGGNNGTLENGSSFSSGKVGQAFQLNGSGQDVRIPASSSIDVGQGNGLTVEVWVNPTDSNGRPVFEWCRDTGGSGVHFWVNYPSAGYITANVVDSTGGFHTVQSPPGIVQPNVYQHLALTYDKASGAATIYANGNAVQQSNVGSFTPQTSYSFYIGARALAAYFQGSIDELSIYSRALTTNELQAIYQASSSGKCPTNEPPFIFAQPIDQIVTIGQTATFTVHAGGTPPLTYQWSFGGTPIDGATSASLVLTNVQMSQTGPYSVQVTNSLNSVTSSNAQLTVNFPPATIRAVDSNADGGHSVTVPIQLLANGNENAMAFSLNFSPSLLTYTSASLGANDSGATLFVNTSQASNGRVGMALSLPTDTTFSAGTQEVVLVTFTAAALSHGSVAPLTFGDQPTPRELSDAHANALAANYSAASVSIAAAQFEGDVSPRPGGDGAVTVTDWVLVGRFVAGLDFPTNNNEFQRADCSPRSTQGDGYLTVSDWVQAGRYAAGLDPLEVAGGPTTPGPNVVVLSPRGLAKTLQSTVRVGSGSFIAGQPAMVSVYLDALGTENALGFSLSFDPSIFTYTGATLGTGAGNASLTINALQVASGHVAFLVGLQPGATFSAGTKEIVEVNFTTSSSASGGTNIALTDQPIRREVDDANASVLPAIYIDGAMAVNPPPTLTVSQTAQNVTLLWPLWASNFVLQITADLSSPVNWTNAPGAVTVINNQNSVTVPANGNPQFYRLKQ